MFYKNLLVFGCVLFFGGCSLWQDFPKPQPNLPVKKAPTKSAIKGTITELTYIEGKYCYTIISTDTTNAKLPKAHFCSSKFYHNKGDLVYVILFGENVESMMLIREASQGAPVAKQGGKNVKTKIAPPKEEVISF